jgi:hypothetical protein
MNRPPQFPETAVALELKETSFSAPPTSIDPGIAPQPGNTLRPSFEVDWDDFDTGSLDE